MKVRMSTPAHIRAEDVPDVIETPREERTKVYQVFNTEGEIKAIDYMVHKRRMRGRADYIRWMVEEDLAGHVLVLDDAMHNIAASAAKAFGGAVGELMAQAEQYSLAERMRR
jgi:hypothetical protein